MKNISILITIFALTACTGIPIKEIRNQQPIWSQTSSRDFSSTFRCLTEHSEFEFLTPDRMHILTFPSGQQVDISIGAIQLGKFKNFYLISLKKNQNQKTDIELRRAEANYMPMNQENAINILNSCL